MKNKILISCISMLFVFQGPTIHAEEGEQANQQPLSETIQYEVKEKLDIQKAPPEIRLDTGEIIESGTERTRDVLQEAKPIPNDEDFENYAALSSNQIIRPWAPLIAEPPLVTFYPGLSKVATKRWEFRVSNEEGDVVKTIKGKGIPPKKFEWNGLDEKGHFIRVGTLYSYQFVTYDEHGNAHTFPGEPFNLDALKFKQKRSLYVEFPADRLFMTDQTTIRPTMKGLWERAVDVIREYSNKPLTVEMYTDTVRSPLVEERRQMIIDKISDATNIPGVDIRHKIDKATDRGNIVRLVMKLR